VELFNNFDFASLFTEDFLTNLFRAGLYLIAGFLLLRIIIFIVKRILKGRVTEQAKMLTLKAINYTGIAVIIVLVLLESGVNLTPILGAAGILGLAVGIASQASLSNVISGLFLVSEKPFTAGDVITVGEKTGIVVSIDLLSVKIRTFDNLYIRIPNEKIVSEEVTNITRYPIRRMNFDISVAYKEDLRRVKELLIEVAHKNKLVLEEPAPFILFREFADSGITILFGCWFQKADYVDVRNTIMQEIKDRFDQEGIEIPFPHRTIYTGSATEPFPVKELKESDVDRKE
jgi:small-conductance mechanosensitive channel